MKNASPNTNPACPFLGLEDDADSSQAFPSNINYCHRCKPVAPVKLNHQAEFCLNTKHRTCSVFLREETGRLPGHIRAQHSRARKTRWNSKGNIIAIIIALIVIIALALFLLQTRTASTQLPAEPFHTASRMPANLPTETPTPSLAITLTLPPPIATGTPTLHIPFFGSFTVTSSPSITPSVVPTEYISRHQLDVPIGTDRKFIIHRLARGESLDPHVQAYNTSVEAVMALNYDLFLANPVKKDVLIVFPFNFSDVSGLHTLKIYQMPEFTHNINPQGPGARYYRGINYEDLILYLSAHIDLNDFKYYNGITEPGDRPLVGDYFLIPQPRLVP
jgi:hypothetical protein